MYGYPGLKLKQLNQEVSVEQLKEKFVWKHGYPGYLFYQEETIDNIIGYFELKDNL